MSPADLWSGGLVRDMGLRGMSRAKTPRTTRSAPREQCPADLVDRHLSAFKPNEPWVADTTYVRTFSGWVHVAFVTDVSSRRIVGWQTSTRLYTDLALDALTMAIWQRQREGADRRDWSTTATVESSTGPYATGRPWRTVRRSPRWGPRVTPTTTPWLRR